MRNDPGRDRHMTILKNSKQNIKLSWQRFLPVCSISKISNETAPKTHFELNAVAIPICQILFQRKGLQ